MLTGPRISDPASARRSWGVAGALSSTPLGGEHDGTRLPPGRVPGGAVSDGSSPQAAASIADPDTRDCPSCRQAIAWDAVFCPRCGTQFDAGSGMGRSRIGVLLTDVEGSTRLWQTHAAVMPEVLVAHHRVVAEVVAAHGGRLPPDQGEGDARLAVFSGDDAAVMAATTALALQDAITALDLPAGIRLRVRMAVDVGDVISFDGNVFGAVVNRCARIRGLGHGGQVLASEDVATTRGVSDGIAITDLGTHLLRDVVDPLRILQLDRPGASASFPPLTGLASAAVVLPEVEGEIVGRDEEIASLGSALKDHRFVTLTGPGGSGKTRLSVAVATAVSEQFPGGVYFVDLVPVAVAADVGRAIASVLGVAEQDDEPWRAAAALAGRAPTLLVIDNAEHLDKLADVLHVDGEELLVAATVLVTSRVPVGVPGEAVVPLAPLAAPPEDPFDEASLVRAPAGELLLARAREVRPGLVVDRESAEHLGAIARRLDGMPLALELAAARLRLQSPASLRAALDRDLGQLADISGRRPERQRVLADLIGWSIEHLDPESRSVLDALSMFAGSPDLAALSAVAGVDEADVLGPLSTLLDASLARAVELADRVPRFTLLVPVREQVRASMPPGTAAGLVQRHTDHHVQWARTGSQMLHNTERDVDWIAEVEVVRPDALLTLERLLASDPDTALGTAVYLSPLWLEFGDIRRGLAVVERALATANPAVSAARHEAEMFLWINGGHELPYAEAIDQLVASAQALASPWLMAETLMFRSVWAEHEGRSDDDSDLVSALDWARRAVAIEEAGTPPPFGLVRACVLTSSIRSRQALTLLWTQPSQARRIVEELVEESEGPRDPTFYLAHQTAASVLLDLGDTDRAEVMLDRLDLLASTGMFLHIGWERSVLAARRGRIQEAARRLATELVDEQLPELVVLESGLASDCLIMLGDASTAAHTLAKALEFPPTRLRSVVSAREARVAYELGDTERAQELLDSMQGEVDLEVARPGTLTYLLTRALVSDGTTRAGWVAQYDALLARYPEIAPWPRDAADRALLG